jgi:hypothetical protein
MTVRIFQARPPFGTVRGGIALLCALLLLPGDFGAYAQSPSQEAAPPEPAAPMIPNDQLDSLVAPIALYPDPLLAQVLVASTYPLEIIQLQQWLPQHKDLKDKALATAVEKEDWDPSIQAMAALPDVVKQLAENIKWTTDLGNAFLAQQNDVMDAVQRMRMKAKDAGNLKSTEQQKVETKTVESKTVVVIQQAQPEIVYLPSYNPVVVYGPPVYPYPPIVYPPVGAYIAGAAISFGVGIAIGAAWGGGWGYNSGWGGNNNITINNNNSFINNSNRNFNRANINRPSQLPSGGGNRWQHNPQHRGGAPYSNRATARQYGGSARGDSLATRQASARQNNRGQLGGGRQQGGTLDRSAANLQRPGTLDRASARQQPRATNRAAGGADRIGNRSVSAGGSARGTGAFGGGSGGYNRGNARASSSRGASSLGSRGGGARGGGRRR